MHSYDEEKEKNDGKHHGGKQSVEDSSDIHNHDFGSVSQEIDDIIEDLDIPSDEKKEADTQPQTPNLNQPEENTTTPPDQNETQTNTMDNEPTNQDQQQPFETPSDEPHTPIISQEPQDDTYSSEDDVPTPDEKNTPLSKQNDLETNTFDLEQTDQNQKQPLDNISFEQQDSGEPQQQETSVPPESLISKPDETQTSIQENVKDIPLSTRPEKTSETQQKKTSKSQHKITMNIFGKKKSKTGDNQIPEKPTETEETIGNKPSTTKNKSFGLFSKKKSNNQQSSEILQNTPTKQLPNENAPTTDAHDDAFHQPIQYQNGAIDQDVLRLLAITDDLLGKLPEEVISEFASSEDFKLYKKVMDRYKIGK